MKGVLFGALIFSAVAVAEFQIVPAEIVLQGNGQEHRVLAGLVDEGAWKASSQASFSSSDPAVAKVSAEGHVTALTNGTTTITATTADGSTDVTTVTVTGADVPRVWSFKNDIQPVLFRMGCNTGACHGAAAGKNGFRLSLRGYDDAADHRALTRQAKGRRVSLAEPAESLMLLKATNAVPHEGGERFGKESHAYQRVYEWIQQGASSVHEGEASVTHLEVLPSAMTLEQGAKQQILVRAHYDNGTYEDVTDWAKYSTNADTLMEVGEDGAVTVIGNGSGAVSVFYASKVATAEVSVPRTVGIEENIYAQAKRNNYVDELILQKIMSLKILPAGDVDDATFIRRAYLDTLGILPTAEEVAAFRDDQELTKRSRLIDNLLERPEFNDYWTYKWSELFILSSKNLPNANELNSFYRFIRSSVEQNKPWDQFAREVITAKGDSSENGAAAYFVMHKEIAKLTETTSQAFLGMSVTCARCHNHPLEKWTQDQYYGMANLLSRVKLKNTDGGTLILASDFGDVLHPRLGRPMPPQPLDGEALALDWQGDRRERLAEWMTSPENPYFTKAIVNRVWANFMGRGLVESVDDLRLTNPPSNAALLDALAADLAEHEFNLKHLMRVIMNSAAYQRSSAPADPTNPDNMHYSQYIVRRLPAEVILDCYAQALSVPTAFPGYPEGTRALQLRDSRVASYFLTAFGRPERNQTCTCERTDDASIAQTLHIANGDTLNNKLRDERSIIKEWIDQDISDVDLLHRLFMRCLGRYPSDQELAETSGLLSALPQEPVARKSARAEAAEDLTWALLSSKEFIFNH